MKSLRFIAIAVCIVTTTASAAPGQESGLSRLNPFKSKKSSRRVRATVTDEKESRWPSMPKISMPKLPTPKMPSLPGMKPASGRPNNSPSTISKINQNTKQFFSKTKDTLMPWTKDEPQRPTSVTGARRPQPTEKKKMFWSSWFKPEPEPNPITSVNDFLKQPRPGGY